MPCGAHNSNSSNCKDCFTSQLLTLSLDVQSDVDNLPDRMAINHMAKVYQRLVDKMSKDKEDDSEFVALCSTLLQTINLAAMAGDKKPIVLDGKAVDLLTKIQPQERSDYKTRLKLLGTWIGFTEFTILARTFDVCFGIMVRVGVRWRRMEVGTGNPGVGGAANGNGRALMFSGAHYEVATFQHHNNGQYDLQGGTTIVTNGYGDCGPEAFLQLLAVENHPLDFTGRHSGRTRQIRRSFAVELARGNTPVDRQAGEYIYAIAELRKLLAYDMSQVELDDAIIAEGRVSFEAEDEEDDVIDKDSGGWDDYYKAFGKRFGLSSTVDTHNSGDETAVCNIGTASDWLSAAEDLRDGSKDWLRARAYGLRSHGKPPEKNLTHTGLLIASFEHKKGNDQIFVCGASNYHESLVKKDQPWTLTGLKQSLGKGVDMHTERFCMVKLHEHILTGKYELQGTMRLVWVLEKVMCAKACQPVLQLFVQHWSSLGIKINSEVIKVDKYFDGNLGKALKGSPWET